jgi:hypothetical protein
MNRGGDAAAIFDLFHAESSHARPIKAVVTLAGPAQTGNCALVYRRDKQRGAGAAGAATIK